MDAVWVVGFPFGAVKVKTTLVPDAGTPPLVTEAAMETVPGTVKAVPETETVRPSEGGVMTVAFAVSVPLDAESAALIFTA